VAPKSELVRIALSPARGGRAVIDHEATMPGRGAYLCRDARDSRARPVAACWARALDKRGLARAMRAPVRIDDELIESMAR
jgi:predicted RNA-binding protein YlxR (DUF448 family)